MNFIQVSIMLTNTDSNYSTGVGQLKKNVCSSIMKPDSHESIYQLYCDNGILIFIHNSHEYLFVTCKGFYSFKQRQM